VHHSIFGWQCLSCVKSRRGAVKSGCLLYPQKLLQQSLTAAAVKGQKQTLRDSVHSRRRAIADFISRGRDRHLLLFCLREERSRSNPTWMNAVKNSVGK
jgi:hypothetical protein